MRKLISPLHIRQLYLLRRCFSTTQSNSVLIQNPLPPPLHRPFSPSFPSFLSHHRLFSSTNLTTENTDETSSVQQQEEEKSRAENLSIELLKNSDAEPLPLPERLDLSFAHIKITPTLILTTLNISPDAGRVALDFLKWSKTRPGLQLNDELYSYFIDYFGRRKDFKAAHEVLVSGHGVVGSKCLESLVDRMVRAGRAAQAVALFESMEKDFGFARNFDSLKLIVSSLCEHGYASYAEKMVKNLATEFFPDEYICDTLIEGWCIDGKLAEAKRLAGEMYRGGFEIGTYSYNAMLDCVCKLCREKDPFRLVSEADKVLVEMEMNGVPRDVDTFNVLITNLCKIRKTDDALNMFHRMGEWGCYPDETTFLLLVKSLYQAARIGEGDEMIDRMKSAGFGDALDKKAYYEFLKILCGIERIDHAMTLFEKMKDDGCEPGIKTYELLMGKLCAHGRIEKANGLYKEAESNGLPIGPKTYKLDPRFNKKKPVVVKEKKRETLPEKMARKRRRLKKIRLSYVKKPKKMMRRSY